jgi:hypothetical protein
VALLVLLLGAMLFMLLVDRAGAVELGLKAK